MTVITLKAYSYQMKTKKYYLVALLAFVALASCDTKTCKCYVYNGNNTPYIEQEYISEGSPCSSLDYQQGTRYRTCIEYTERDIDPNDIGQEYKGI